MEHGVKHDDRDPNGCKKCKRLPGDDILITKRFLTEILFLTGAKEIWRVIIPEHNILFHRLRPKHFQPHPKNLQNRQLRLHSEHWP